MKDFVIAFVAALLLVVLTVWTIRCVMDVFYM